ncbi:MAG: polysaccharide deacetylase family protein [Planctomycetota bacterium]
MSALHEKFSATSFAKKAHQGLVYCGLHSGFRELWRAVTGRRHLILGFHRVYSVSQSADLFDSCPSMSVDYFRKVIEDVSERFTVLPLQELCGYAGKGPCAAITFDDGWRDNYDVAFPVLRELDIPATIFVTTGKIGNSQPFWQQILGRAFCCAGEDPHGQVAQALRAVLQVESNTPLTPKYFRHTTNRWKKLTSSQREELLCDAGCAALLPEQPRCFLSTDEICEMAQAGITFGSHTVTHSILPWECHSTIKRELAESRACLENLLGYTINALSYPNGQYSHEVIDIARATGYAIACTTAATGFSRRDDRMRIPRVDAGFYGSPFAGGWL